MEDVECDSLFSFDWRVLKAVSFKLPGETSFRSGVGLGIGRFSWVGEAIQEVGRRNLPPCLRNRLFPKSVHVLLEVVGMLDSVSTYLQDFKLREGCILESRADQQGGAEVGPLPVQSLLARILCISWTHGFLRSIEIMHESSCGVRRHSCHEMCGYR